MLPSWVNRLPAPLRRLFHITLAFSLLMGLLVIVASETGSVRLGRLALLTAGVWMIVLIVSLLGEALAAASRRARRERPPRS